MIRFITALILTGFTTNVSLAQESSGRVPLTIGSSEQLLAYCESAGKPEMEADIKLTICMSYLMGVLDAHEVIAGLHPSARMMCPPDNGVSNDQARRIVVKWLANHPEYLHLPSRATSLKAMAEAFPCK